MKKRPGVCVGFVVTSLVRDGAQAMLLKLARQLLRHGFDPVVVSLTAPGPLADEVGRAGIRSHYLGVRPGRVSLPALGRLVGVLRAERPALIQGWMYHGNLAAQLAGCFIADCPPVVWSIRGAHTDLTREKKLTALTIWAGAKLSARPAAIIYNSVASAVDHWRKLKYHRERAVVIPNGFDTTAFAPSAAARAWCAT